MKKMDMGILTDTDMKRPRYKLLYALIAVLLIIYCFAVLIPVVWIILSGFKNVKELYAVPSSFFPKKIDLGKLSKVWTEMKIYKYYINTFIMAGGATVAACLVGGLAGYSISKLKPKGTGIIFMILFWIMLMPGTLRTVPLYIGFKDVPLFHISLLDTFWPIWIMSASSIFNIILFKNFFDGISGSIIEAAKIDGASAMRIFAKIVMPLSVPVFVTVAIFTFNGQVGQFFWPYLLIKKKELTVLGVQMYTMQSSNYTMDYQMLAILFSILPQLLIFAVFQKKIIGGVSVGAVKG